MTKLSEQELQIAVKALTNASGQEQVIALSSQSSFISFLKRSGLIWLANKVRDILEDIWDWLIDTISDLF